MDPNAALEALRKNAPMLVREQGGSRVARNRRYDDPSC
jgi:hypothetical protein